jgi:putative ABC transport system substrate-binding protein
MAEYVDKILKGANPGDLPIQIKARSELVINTKTATEIGVTIPAEIIKRADRELS